MTACRLKSRKPIRQRLKQYWPAYLLLLPVVIWYLIFCYAPMGGLVIAFKKYSVIRGIADSPWVGWQNFEKLFSSAAFVRSIKNTLIISGLNLLVGFPIPIVFAILLNEMRYMRFKKLVQTVSYLPHFISWSVAGGMVYMLLSPSTGAISAVVRALGGQPQNYLGLSKYFRTIVVASHVWKSIGWSAIIYMAAISSVDEQLYEAALIDGAGRFARIWHVTLPGIRSIISIQLILAVGNILTVSFDQIFILINDLTLEVGETIDYFIYRVGLGSSNNFSLATASGMLKSVIGLALVLVTNAVCRKLTDGEGIW
ncbi:ABC transporter permease subunit [Beduinella massiliensis]|uniref:ABC transporter permease subunit n=1 Tax=Beduinella massiliensis TaxID=1852363 RepID=UPI000C84C782